MKTIAKLLGFVCMLSFLAFAWLSHTGVLPGDDNTHSAIVIGAFLLAVGGFVLLALVDEVTTLLTDSLAFTYSILLILNAIAYIFLRSLEKIGPYVGHNEEWTAFTVGGLYIILAGFGLFLMYSIINDRDKLEKKAEEKGSDNKKRITEVLEEPHVAGGDG